MMNKQLQKASQSITNEIRKISKILDLEHFGPTKEEFAVFSAVSIGIFVLLTVNDIVIFDNYPKPIMNECYVETNPNILNLLEIEPTEVDPNMINMTTYMDAHNRDSFCKFWREQIGITDESQLSFGAPHWNILTTNFLVIAIVIGAIRTLTSWFWQIKNGRRFFHWVKVVMGLVWFVGTLIWFYFGYLDLGYYIFRGNTVPESLPWLNDLGLFIIAKDFTGSSNVESLDLTILAIIGGCLYVIIWAGVYLFYKKEKSDLMNEAKSYINTTEKLVNHDLKDKISLEQGSKITDAVKEVKEVLDKKPDKLKPKLDSLKSIVNKITNEP